MSTIPKLSREQAAAFHRLEKLRRSMGPGLQKPQNSPFSIVIAPRGDFVRSHAMSKASI